MTLTLVPMRLSNIHWPLTLGGALLAEAVFIAAAFAWVAIYSHLLDPGHPLAFYQEYARSASPWVSLLLGVPVFFLVARWIGVRHPPAGMPAAMALFALYCTVEIPLMISTADSSATWWFAAVNFPTKFAGCYLGGRAALRHGAVAHT